jgi:hypothetical protein
MQPVGWLSSGMAYRQSMAWPRLISVVINGYLAVNPGESFGGVASAYCGSQWRGVPICNGVSGWLIINLAYQYCQSAVATGSMA